MVVYSKAAMERAMKVQEVILRAMAKKITWCRPPRLSASAIGRCGAGGSGWKSLAMTDCSTGDGDNLSPKRVPLAMVEQVLGMYRDRYFDLNVQHFHEKLGEQP